MDLSIQDIKLRMCSVFSFLELNNRNIIESTDMILPSLIFAFYLLNLYFIDKLRLTYIYIVFFMGILIIYFIIKQIAKVIFFLNYLKEDISLYTTISILFYCLSPISLLSFLATIFTLDSMIGYIVSISIIFYCSHIATKFFNLYLRLSDREILLFYPCILFYTCFTILML